MKSSDLVKTSAGHAECSPRTPVCLEAPLA